MSNYLRTKKIVVGDKEIVVKEFSIASSSRFQGYEKIDSDLLFKESLNEEDYQWYIDNKENIPFWVKKEIDTIIIDVNKRPEWLPPIPEVKDNKPFRETTIGNTTVEKLE